MNVAFFHNARHNPMFIGLPPELFCVSIHMLSPIIVLT